MPVTKLLIANRGEIAIRIARAAADLALPCVAVHSIDDATSLHVGAADESVALPLEGPAAYLDGTALIAIAQSTGCDAVHPGYGFLAESADFAAACDAAGLTFVGPDAKTLATLGDKARARQLASLWEVPVLPGTAGPTSLEEAQRFIAKHGLPVMVKAIAGGGGRGLRRVDTAEALASAYARARSEAGSAFGVDTVYLERAMSRPRHVEIQIVGDGRGAVRALGERECTLQRNHQKVVEIAPSPSLSADVRRRLCDYAMRLAQAVTYRGLGTFEFLLAGDEIAFIEANPRLQVEHTITEEVFGVDLVATQLRIAGGASLAELGLAPEVERLPRGRAMQLRLNLERMANDGSAVPASGTLTRLRLPGGPGVRVDTYGYGGYTSNPRFDSLLAKVIVHTPSDSFAALVGRAQRALDECVIDGVATNLDFLRGLLRQSEIAANQVDTDTIRRLAPKITAEVSQPRRWHTTSDVAPSATGSLAGAQIDHRDPLAVLEHGKRTAPADTAVEAPDDGSVVVRTPLQGTVVAVEVAPGATVHAGQSLLIVEAMKMEHLIAAPVGGVVERITVGAGQTVLADSPLLYLRPDASVGAIATEEEAVDLDHIRPDLAEVIERHSYGLDARRPESVARRRATGQRTARENIADLCDEGSFVEYGALVIAAQRRRRPEQELIEKTPADGLITGVGRINSALFPREETRSVVLAYDYTVLAGTQGLQNHRKKDRMFELAHEQKLPVVFFTEGGGGRPGDTDGMGVAGLDCMAFRLFAELSGEVPLIGINAGRCFAGNAALLGCCDVIIATRDSNIGMGGPAMIEGGGLGVFRPEDVGPIEVQRANGVVDLVVADEAEGVRRAKQYLGYFQGDVTEWTCRDQRLLRAAIPENRLRVYDVRRVIETLADDHSVLELRRDFGLGMVTALARIEGRALGIVANNPTHLAGAIDSDGADKAARFLQLCDAFGLPVLFLCDTPGIMVGPEAEKTATVRHAARLFLVGAALRVPYFTIVLRKGYGLGAQAMAAGSFKSPRFTMAWPTGEFGGMGLEGAVKLGFRKELAAIADSDERRRVFDEMVARLYEHGKATNMASHFEIDGVIDPADTRRTIVGALPPGRPARGERRRWVEAW